MIRDLFVADAVKVEALRAYVTTRRGSQVKLRIAPSIDAWLAVVIAIVSVILGAIATPVAERLLGADSKNAAERPAAPYPKP